MIAHVSISPTEIANRLAIRELVDGYAHCADRRDTNGQMSLFTANTHFVVFMDPKSNEPSMELNRRDDLAPVFADLNQYEATTHCGSEHCCSGRGSCDWGNLLHHFHNRENVPE